MCDVLVDDDWPSWDLGVGTREEGPLTPRAAHYTLTVDLVTTTCLITHMVDTYHRSRWQTTGRCRSGKRSCSGTHILCTHHSFLAKRSMDRSPSHSRLPGESRYYPRRYAKIVLVIVDIDLRKLRTGLCMCIILKVNCWSQVDMLTPYHQRWRYFILFTIVGLHFK